MNFFYNNCNGKFKSNFNIDCIVVLYISVIYAVLENLLLTKQ